MLKLRPSTIATFLSVTLGSLTAVAQDGWKAVEATPAINRPASELTGPPISIPIPTFIDLPKTAGTLVATPVPVDAEVPKPVAPIKIIPAPSDAPLSNAAPAPKPDLPANVNSVPCDLPAQQPVWEQWPPVYFTPFMLGDFIGPVANMFSDVKIAEGESPRPMDRVFYRGNYFNNLDKSRWTNPRETIHNVSLYQNVFGFEKTFMNERLSLGVRIPFYTLDAPAKEFSAVAHPATGNLTPVAGGPGFTSTNFGNISAIVKALLAHDDETGSLISGGATLSIPTASSKLINPGQSILAYVQPFGGGILSRGDLFVQGFTSITLPVASAESIVFFADVGVGYYVYRNTTGNGILTAVAPMFEIHIAAPLRSPDPNADIFGFKDGLLLHDVVNLTFGSTFEFKNRSVLGVGLVVPTTGPKPFDFELIVQLNQRF
ncbi:MAG: hypothetical protein K8T89_00760 [Planctomycetes bacterium]|nr:hypothetical protein [Planctomycetota bacterium]